MGGLWSYYRFDFSESTGGTAKVPKNSYEWDMATADWKLRIADAPIDLSDAFSPVSVQIDTASTDVYANNSTNIDINIAGRAVNFGTTSLLGCRYDNASSGYYWEEKLIADGLIKTFALTTAPPMIKFRFDDNTTGIGAAHVFLSFKRKYT